MWSARQSRSSMVAVLVAGALAAGACGSGDGPPAGGATRTLRVLAASSLAEAFTELGQAFERDHPGVTVTFAFAGSSSLVRQVQEGAPADVVATADRSTMTTLVDAGLVASPVVVARNRLALVVERGNPKGIRGLADLSRAGVVLVVCAPAVPCGKLAERALAGAGVTVTPASLEENVKAVVSKVALGEADAGIVYETDVRAAADAVTGVPLGAKAAALEAVYPIATTRSAGSVARDWVDYVRSAAGQHILSSHGFLAL